MAGERANGAKGIRRSESQIEALRSAFHGPGSARETRSLFPEKNAGDKDIVRGASSRFISLPFMNLPPEGRLNQRYRKFSKWKPRDGPFETQPLGRGLGDRLAGKLELVPCRVGCLIRAAANPV